MLISSTVSSPRVAGTFRDLGAPVIVWEGGVYDDMGMTPSTGTFYAEPTGLSSLSISDPAHPLAAGLSGTRTVTTASSTLKWGNPGSSAARVATIGGIAGRAAIFAYETGAGMTSLTAPARRVGIFLHDATAASLSADGMRLLDASIAWARGG